MGRLTINWATNGIVPPGDYLVEVDRVTLCDKTDGSTQFLRLDLTVAEGEHAETQFDMVITLDPELFEKFAAPMLDALGVDLSDGNLDLDYAEELRTMSWGDEYDRVVIEPYIVGRRAVASVVHREFSGRTYVRVLRLKAVAS